ncbi:MAG TPA: hypothetical protein GX717_02750, partial [Clostridiaceae bacterium]|nr:hypothetical protein [Clostridiaceae bacterium]
MAEEDTEIDVTLQMHTIDSQAESEYVNDNSFLVQTDENKIYEKTTSSVASIDEASDNAPDPLNESVYEDEKPELLAQETTSVTCDEFHESDSASCQVAEYIAESADISKEAEYVIPSDNLEQVPTIDSVESGSKNIYTEPVVENMTKESAESLHPSAKDKNESETIISITSMSVTGEHSRVEAHTSSKIAVETLSYVPI